MLYKGIFAVLVTALLMLSACEDESVDPPARRSAWSVEPDSMNLGLLILNGRSLEFEAGRVDHYSGCEACDVDSLPFYQSCVPPNDVGSLTFQYSATSDTLLHAGVTYMGNGWIEYPTKFLSPNEFARVAHLPNPPLSVEFFGHCAKMKPSEDMEAAWIQVRTLDVVKEFATAPYRVGVLRYNASYFDDELDKLIVFLYRGPVRESFAEGAKRPSNKRIQLTSASVTPRAGHASRQPAEYGGRGRS